MTRPGALSALGVQLLGPVVWAAYFLVVYASESLVCSRIADPDVHRALLAAATVTAAALLVALAIRPARRAPLAPVGFGLVLLSMLAVTWTALPAIFLPACS